MKGLNTKLLHQMLRCHWRLSQLGSWEAFAGRGGGTGEGGCSVSRIWSVWPCSLENFAKLMLRVGLTGIFFFFSVFKGTEILYERTNK